MFAEDENLLLNGFKDSSNTLNIKSFDELFEKDEEFNKLIK